jgi:hypothetical protein
LDGVPFPVVSSCARDLRVSWQIPVQRSVARLTATVIRARLIPFASFCKFPPAFIVFTTVLAHLGVVVAILAPSGIVALLATNDALNRTRFVVGAHFLSLPTDLDPTASVEPDQYAA